MTCVLCANPVGDSPVVGIGREDLFTNSGEMTKHPVCAACYVDPTHRLINHKVHFAYVTMADTAVDTARTLDQMSKEGKDLSL